VTNPQIEKYLATQEIFSGLNPEFVGFLAGCTSERQIEKGDVLFHRGEHARKFYLVCDGRIVVEIPAITGPTLEIQSLGEGEILGWSWLIPPYKWNFQATAEEETELLEFDGEAVLARCEQEPEFGYELLKRFAALMSARLDAARQKIMDQWNPAGFA
jgi:CRP-like cAMP-binding protein